jgi:hypothetical protein
MDGLMGELNGALGVFGEEGLSQRTRGGQPVSRGLQAVGRGSVVVGRGHNTGRVGGERTWLAPLVVRSSSYSEHAKAKGQRPNRAT